MAPVTIPPVERAQSIFTELGYTVSGEGAAFQAEHEWRTVHVTALGADGATDERALADGGTDERALRCYVTYHELTGDLRERLGRADPPFEWAIIGVDADGEGYDVVDRAETL
jgi:hypothetical protein